MSVTKHKEGNFDTVEEITIQQKAGKISHAIQEDATNNDMISGPEGQNRESNSKAIDNYLRQKPNGGNSDPNGESNTIMNMETNNYGSVDIGDGKRDHISGLKVFKTLAKRQKYSLFFIAVGSLLTGVTFSMMGPFYPMTATRKGMGMTLVGVVYGLFGIVIFFTAPFFGKHLTKLGPNFTVVAGMFLGGCSNILFGTLIYCPDGAPFIVMSILIRCTEAVGFAAYITSSFVIVANEFKENIAFVLGILEIAEGIGFMLGPVIGGALYELGGFEFPFYFAGLSVLANGIFAFRFLPQVEETPAKRKASVLSLLQSPLLTVSLGCLLLGAINNGAYHSTFADHAQSLHISVFLIGVLYAWPSALYSISAAISGYISDTLDCQAPLLIGGQLVYGIGFFILGPSQLLPFVSFTLSTAIIGRTCISASYGFIFVSTMRCTVKGAIEIGYENNLDTIALVSGLFNGVNTLGRSIGPFSIGALIDKYGYPISYTVVGMLSMICMVAYMILFTFRRCRKIKLSGGMIP